jgi:hypothetical protein
MARQRHLSRAARARMAASLAPRAAGGLPAAVVERVTRLTVRQRKYLFALLDTGNVRLPVLQAGYQCKSVRSAETIVNVP